MAKPQQADCHLFDQRSNISKNLVQVRDKVSAFITDFGKSIDMWGCSERDGSVLMNLKERDIILANRGMITNPLRKYVTNSWLRLCHINPLSLAIVLLWPPHSERSRFDLALPRSALCNIFA